MNGYIFARELLKQQLGLLKKPKIAGKLFPGTGKPLFETSKPPIFAKKSNLMPKLSI